MHYAVAFLALTRPRSPVLFCALRCKDAALVGVRPADRMGWRHVQARRIRSIGSIDSAQPAAATPARMNRSTMSNIQVAGARTLPFTGLATLPILLIGAAISVTGFLLTILRAKPSRSV
jgi:hypothetical protein